MATGPLIVRNERLFLLLNNTTATEKVDCFNLGRLLNAGCSTIISLLYQISLAKDCESASYNTDNGANILTVKLVACVLGKIVYQL